MSGPDLVTITENAIPAWLRETADHIFSFTAALAEDTDAKAEFARYLRGLAGWIELLQIHALRVGRADQMIARAERSIEEAARLRVDLERLRQRLAEVEHA